MAYPSDPSQNSLFRSKGMPSIIALLLSALALLLSGCPYNAGHFDSPRYDYNARRPPPRQARLLRWVSERVCEVEYYRGQDRWTWLIYVLSPAEIATGSIERANLPDWVDSGKVPAADQSLLRILESEFPAGCHIDLSYPLAKGDLESEEVQGVTSLSMFLATVKKSSGQ